MPIPGQQLAQLQADLQTHQRRIQTLKEIIADAKSELAQLGTNQQAPASRRQSLNDLLADAESETVIHETIIKLGQDSKILAALGEVHDKPELADQILSNPAAFMQARGIQLPSGVTVTATRSTSHSATVIARYQAGRIQDRMQWDMSTGFTSQEIR